VTGRRLRELLGAELAHPAPAGARSIAADLARRGGAATSVVLYYGSALRAGSLEGILDFYVLLDRVGAWPGSLAARLANRWLPPNVGYLEFEHEGQRLRAKFAVMSRAQFAQRLTDGTRDTTIWARFCQPALCVWARSPADRDAATELAAAAVVRASVWAARLGPDVAPAESFWRALFAQTYGAELRVERTARPDDIVARQSMRYIELLPLAWQEAGMPFVQRDDGQLAPQLAKGVRRAALRRWRSLARWGRWLNAGRLLKASFTFEGAMDYVAWKIERHRGVRIEVRPWQRRFPVLAAPFLYWKLRRLGVLSKRVGG
jgi:hypothetical protein